MDLFSQSKPKAYPEKLQSLKSLINEIFEIDSEIPVSISQLQCSEPDCPPIETVIAIMTTPAQQYKIHKSVAEIDSSDISALIQPIK